MKYYTIQNDGLLIADNRQALERFYDNVSELPNDYEQDKYIAVDGELVLNPNYEEEQAQKERERRNQEINQKISELEQMAISDVLQGNKENVNTYNQVITSLRENLVMGY